MLHACVERFDVMGGRGNILGWDGEVNKACIQLLVRAAVGKVLLRRLAAAFDLELLHGCCFTAFMCWIVVKAASMRASPVVLLLCNSDAFPI
jgi:hypothetical protein